MGDSKSSSRNRGRYGFSLCDRQAVSNKAVSYTRREGRERTGRERGRERENGERERREKEINQRAMMRGRNKEEIERRKGQRS